MQCTASHNFCVCFNVSIINWLQREIYNGLLHVRHLILLAVDSQLLFAGRSCGDRGADTSASPHNTDHSHDSGMSITSTLLYL